MTENPYVFLIASGAARVGRAVVHEFYANHFLPKIPPDLEITSLSQSFGNDRIAEEMVIRFTHAIEMDWLLPGLRPTGQIAEFVLAAIIQFQDGKVAHEHLYWDQATVLSQMGVLNHPMAATGVASAGKRPRRSQ
jgi:carboxymethylenebutenolidase